MKIAIIGIRGFNIIYSGFESFITNLIPSLVKKNLDISVYCRSHYYTHKKRNNSKGIKLVYLPTLKNKYLESFIHSFLSTIHACFVHRPKVIYFLGVGNSVFVIIARLFGIKTIINVDGLDWRRGKWNFIAQNYLRFSQFLAVKFANQVITDSRYMQDYYKRSYQKETVYIPYSHYPKFKENIKIFKEYKLEKKKYYIWVGRLVPDNNLEELLKAYVHLKTSFKCVIVGDSTYEEGYKTKIYKWSEQDQRIIFTGFLDRDNYLTLLKNAYCYIETKRSGGTHPTLIEAILCKCNIISNNHEANKIILGNKYVLYEYKKGYKDLLKKILNAKKHISKKIAFTQFFDQYNHQNIVENYYELFMKLFNNY